MFILPALAAIAASLGWATGIVLAQGPAQKLGAFEFTRIQLVSCSAIIGVAVTILGYWDTIEWAHASAFAASVVVGIVLGNLAMIECLRLGGPRRTELLLSLKAPIVTVMAFIWFKEEPGWMDLAGMVVVLTGVGLAIIFGSDAGSQTDSLNSRIGLVVVLGVTATACQGFGFLVMKPAMLAGMKPLAASAICLLGAALIISVIGLWPTKALRGKTDLSPGLLGRTILPGFIGYGVSSTLLLYAFATVMPISFAKAFKSAA